jgi:hypothetical protein
MACYLRTAGTVPVLSDGAGNALQAWDMLHGNVLLHGWWATDVSFYTTELPELMLIEVFAGLHPEVVHIGAALTYTLLVLLAALVARGRARGAEGAVRALLAGGIILAPEPGAATWIVQSSPDHMGAGVPVLVLLLLLEFAPRPTGGRGDGESPRAARKRAWVPVAAGILLAWATIGDPITIVVGSAALALACLLRAVRRARAAGLGETGPRGAGPGERRGLRAAWYELSLAAAAVVAVPVATAAEHVIRAMGGYNTNGTVSGLVPPPTVSRNVPLVVRSFLAMFGADWPSAHGRLYVAFAFAHLAGVALVVAAIAVAAWRLLRSLLSRSDGSRADGSRADPGDLVTDVLVIAVVGNVVAFLLMFGVKNIYFAHEIGPVLSLGAALAGRVFGGPVARARLRLVPVLAAGLACYAVMLGFAVTRGQAPPQNAALAAWLDRHGLRDGIAPYWQGTSVTLDSHGAVRMLPVVAGRDGRLAPRHWLADLRLADPATRRADFLVVAPGGPVTQRQARATFGPPAKVYRYQDFTILTWDKNLLRELGHPTSLRSRADSGTLRPGPPCRWRAAR